MPTNGPTEDNPPVMAPAGGVHATIADWSKFIADQLKGSRGERALLQPDTYQKSHTPPFGGDYALGWLIADRGWGGGTVYNHNGSSNMDYATVWVAPQRDFAFLSRNAIPESPYHARRGCCRPAQRPPRWSSARGAGCTWDRP